MAGLFCILNIMFDLVEVITKDGLPLTGIMAKPKNNCDTVLFWVHGLTSNFYSNQKLLNSIAKQVLSEDIAFASFNNRGHDMVSGFKRAVRVGESNEYNYVNIGAGYEVFEECVLDLEAVINYLISLGYKKIFLAGHSSGANKASYFQGKLNNNHVNGVILLSPMSDRLISAGTEKTNISLNLALDLISKNQEQQLRDDLGFFPMTPKRFLSLNQPQSAEDQFGYGDIPTHMPEFSQIKTPLLVVFAEDDEYKDRPVQQIKEIFDKTTTSLRYTSEIIFGSNHSFDSKNEELIGIITRFIKQNL